MDERLKFVARLLDGEKMAGLCCEFGISRKTGYKILTRYNEIGLEASPTAHAGRTAKPISYRSRSRPRSCASSRTSRAGARPRSGIS